jgi:phage terminase large subunit-like protein
MIKPDKGKSTEKIDGLAAAANAFAMAIDADEQLDGPSPDDYRIVSLW